MLYEESLEDGAGWGSGVRLALFILGESVVVLQHSRRWG